jgi:hypothetical protein
VGVELLLQVAEDVDAFFQQVGRFVFVLDPARFVRIDIVETKFLAVGDAVGLRIVASLHGADRRR